ESNTIRNIISFDFEEKIMNEKEIEGGISFSNENQEREDLKGTVKIGGEMADMLRQSTERPTKVALQRTSSQPTADQVLWTAIRNRTQAIGFNRYRTFI